MNNDDEGRDDVDEEIGMVYRPRKMRLDPTLEEEVNMARLTPILTSVRPETPNFARPTPVARPTPAAPQPSAEASAEASAAASAEARAPLRPPPDQEIPTFAP